MPKIPRIYSWGHWRSENPVSAVPCANHRQIAAARQLGGDLNPPGRAVDFLCLTSTKPFKHMLRWDRWLSKYDLHRLTVGSSKQLPDAPTLCATPASRRERLTANPTFDGATPSVGCHSTRDHLCGEACTFRSVRDQPLHLRDIPKLPQSRPAPAAQPECPWTHIANPIEIECTNRAPNTRVGIDPGLNTLVSADEHDNERHSFRRLAIFAWMLPMPLSCALSGSWRVWLRAAREFAAPQ
jgi:hypothetical protein